MLGKTEKQLSYSDYWLEGRIPENSYWHKMRKWSTENLKEEMFQPLFSYYGRRSISPVYTFMVWGKCAKQDTYTMIYQAIKMVLRLAKFGDIPVEGLVVLKWI